MFIFEKTKSILKRMQRDESGIAALSWALSMTVIIGAMGAAVDFAMLSSADARSQTIADTTALSAAIYVKNFEQIPANRDKGLIGDYTANELGYDYRSWVIDGADGVTVNVSYDEVKREATATVTGYTQPTLMQILGFGELKFNARTVVKFEEKDVQDPVSVVMVMDNSGSMGWDDTPVTSNNGSRPNPHQSRIEGLETAAINFMTKLDDVVGQQDPDGPDDAVLRTGLLAFASSTTITRNMDWGVLADSEITAMTASGATNSAPPLQTAKEWLTLPDKELKAHLDENGKTPGRYVVLMTDGKNTVGNEEWVAREGTENWRAWLPTETTETIIVEVEVVVTVPAVPGTTSREVITNYTSDLENCRWEGGYPRETYTIRVGSRNYTWRNTRSRYVCDVTTEGTEAYERIEIQEQEREVTTTTYDWEYREQEEEPLEAGNWEEGEFDIESNILTRAECDALHTAGVNVFTIAFALEPGFYYRNSYYTTRITEEDSNKARAILQYCASKPENFITADNAEALNDTFERIGDTIVKEIVRISS